MRLSLLMLGFLLGTAAIATRAEAEDYPWCAIYSKDGGTHCAFSTQEQCLAGVSGIGGFCEFRPSAATTVDPNTRRRTRPKP
jgi:hypothetical protein